jgi:hypothetical protein
VMSAFHTARPARRAPRPRAPSFNAVEKTIRETVFRPTAFQSVGRRPAESAWIWTADDADDADDGDDAG